MVEDKIAQCGHWGGRGREGGREGEKSIKGTEREKERERKGREGGKMGESAELSHTSWWPISLRGVLAVGRKEAKVVGGSCVWGVERENQQGRVD